MSFKLGTESIKYTGQYVCFICLNTFNIDSAGKYGEFGFTQTGLILSAFTFLKPVE